jgi:hypothetical protein
MIAMATKTERQTWTPWSAPAIWHGETVAILGGGPSLTLDQVASAKRFHRIATNEAFRLDPNVEVLCWGDMSWYALRWEELAKHPAPLKIGWLKDSLPLPKTRPGIDPRWMRAERKSPPAIQLYPDTIGGLNTGHGAINLAMHFGAKRILLLGFDMTNARGYNWHVLHQFHAGDEKIRKFFVPQMEMAAKELSSIGVEVINCSPGSALTCFPIARIEDIR